MKSIYDMMSKSSVQDLNGNEYPDPLSIDLKKLSLSVPIEKFKVSRTICRKPYLVSADMYLSNDLDDLILWLNKCPCWKFLYAGQSLSVVYEEDLLRFYKSQVVSE